MLVASASSWMEHRVKSDSRLAPAGAMARLRRLAAAGWVASIAAVAVAGGGGGRGDAGAPAPAPSTAHAPAATRTAAAPRQAAPAKPRSIPIEDLATRTDL